MTKKIMYHTNKPFDEDKHEIINLRYIVNTYNTSIRTLICKYKHRYNYLPIRYKTTGLYYDHKWDHFYAPKGLKYYLKQKILRDLINYAFKTDNSKAIIEISKQSNCDHEKLLFNAIFYENNEIVSYITNHTNDIISSRDLLLAFKLRNFSIIDTLLFSNLNKNLFRQFYIENLVPQVLEFNHSLLIQKVFETLRFEEFIPLKHKSNEFNIVQKYLINKTNQDVYKYILTFVSS